MSIIASAMLAGLVVALILWTQHQPMLAICFYCNEELVPDKDHGYAHEDGFWRPARPGIIRHPAYPTFA